MAYPVNFNQLEMQKCFESWLSQDLAGFSISANVSIPHIDCEKLYLENGRKIMKSLNKISLLYKTYIEKFCIEGKNNGV